MRSYILLVIGAALLATTPASAEEKEKAVVGEVVEVSRKAILPNWEPTAKAVTRNVENRCYPIAAEALAQLDYFFQILEIAKEKVPAKDPIAADQPTRKTQLDKLRGKVSKMPKENAGCPDRSLKGRGK